MDVMISTYCCPYDTLWNKRGSKYLTTTEADALYNLGTGIIKSEVNSVIGKYNPYLCSEDLMFIIATETYANSSYLPDIPIIDPLPEPNPDYEHSLPSHMDDFVTEEEVHCLWEVYGNEEINNKKYSPWETY